MSTTDGLTVREEVVEQIESFLANMTGVSPSDPGYFTVSEVWREPPKDLKSGKAVVAVILEQTELKNERTYPLVECNLSVFVELHVMRTDPNDKMSKLLNNRLGLVERMFRSDRTLGGKAVEIIFTRNEMTPTGVYDNYGSAMMAFTVLYRHHSDDPRQRL